jgi:hypothetical protein
MLRKVLKAIKASDTLNTAVPNTKPAPDSGRKVVFGYSNKQFNGPDYSIEAVIMPGSMITPSEAERTVMNMLNRFEGDVSLLMHMPLSGDNTVVIGDHRYQVVATVKTEEGVNLTIGNKDLLKGVGSTDINVTIRRARVDEIISEYIARIAKDKGPGAIPELSRKELRAVWDMVGLLHDSRIEILLPRNIKLTESMKKALADIRKRDGGDVIKCREYTDADHLGKMLGQAPDAGTKRIVVTETSMTDAVSSLVTANPQLFKEVRLYNTTLPKDYDSMSQVEKTVCQARAINIAILMRLFEKEKTPMVEMLLRIALTGRLDDGVGMDDFINKIAEGDPAYALQRILWFLSKPVRLVEQLGKELRLLKEVWTAA